MAIPEGRMSTVPVPGSYGPPEDRKFYALTNYEQGPIAIEDTSEGLQYQNWTLTWNPANNELTAYPETTQVPVVIVTVADLITVSFTFDQAGRISFAYTTLVSSYLYWYDTALGYTVTTDLGATAITPALLLDDKRKTQFVQNDMLLWYTKLNGATYDLYMLRQRDRFLTEYLMDSGLPYAYIHNIGMHNALRLQLTLKPYLAGVPYVPAPPTDPDNLDFEKGNVNWVHEAGSEFSINQNSPETGFWNATLTSSGAYSRFVNGTFFPVTGGQQITIKMSAKGTLGQGIGFGFQGYDAGYAYLGRSEYGISVTANWVTEEWIFNVQPTAAYIKLVTSSNGLIGTFHVDNFTLVS